MKQSKLNLIIDAIMLVIMVAIIGIGLLVKYILLTGQEKWEKFGENFEFIVFGLDRHQWGQLHFILGIVLFGLLVLHIILHWKMIVCIYKKLIKNRIIRTGSAIVLLVVSICLVIFPFLVKPGIDKSIPHNKNQHSDIYGGGESKNADLVIETEGPQATEIPTETRHSHDKHLAIPTNIEVMGSMTLIEVSKKYKVPVNHIKKALDLPGSTSDKERLGRLRKIKDFSMNDLEEIIYKYQKQESDDKKN